jgi:hypothetical protein
VLVAGGEHRGVSGVGHRRAHHPRDAAEPGQGLLRPVRVEVDLEGVRDRLQKGALGVGDPVRPLVVSDPGHSRGQLGDGVVVVAEGAVPRSSVGHQVEPGDALLRGLDQIEAEVVVDGERETADLADRLGAPLELVGVVIHQPLSAETAARLLVRAEHQGDGASRRHPGPRPGAHHAEHHGVEVLHVHRTAAPDAAVGDLPGERRHRPVVGVGGHHVQVAVHQQRRDVAVHALRGPAGHESGPTGSTLEEL